MKVILKKKKMLLRLVKFYNYTLEGILINEEMSLPNNPRENGLIKFYFYDWEMNI